MDVRVLLYENNVKFASMDYGLWVLRHYVLGCDRTRGIEPRLVFHNLFSFDRDNMWGLTPYMNF
jgi:hypothetical protein